MAEVYPHYFRFFPLIIVRFLRVKHHIPFDHSKSVYDYFFYRLPIRRVLFTPLPLRLYQSPVPFPSSKTLFVRMYKHLNDVKRIVFTN